MKRCKSCVYGETYTGLIPVSSGAWPIRRSIPEAATPEYAESVRLQKGSLRCTTLNERIKGNERET
jgi:hypothetical protein